MTEPWKHRAACHDKPSEWWFPYQSRIKTVLDANNREAIQICKTCPVQQQCLTHAQKQPETFGIWGGLTTEQRRNLRRNNHTPIPHGTKNGYNRHIRYGEPACEPCKKAHADYSAAMRRISQRAKTRHDTEGFIND